MNDWHNDPPDYPEPPEWWQNLEDAIEDDDMPEVVKAAVQKAMNDWADEQNKNDAYYPSYE